MKESVKETWNGERMENIVDIRITILGYY